MNSENGTSFWEKWYWANFLRGTNPVTTFISGLIRGLWIPLVLSAIFCFVTDPQWNHAEGMGGWSIAKYLHYFYYFWHGVISITFHWLHVYWNYFWEHMGSAGRWIRHMLWLDKPEYFDGLKEN